MVLTEALMPCGQHRGRQDLSDGDWGTLAQSRQKKEMIQFILAVEMLRYTSSQ
jgi:hypothetical protein